MRHLRRFIFENAPSPGTGHQAYERSVVVTVHDDFVRDLDSIAELMSQDGLGITNLYHELGVIVGTADEETIGKIRSRKQVESVSDEKVARPQ